MRRTARFFQLLTFPIAPFAANDGGLPMPPEVSLPIDTAFAMYKEMNSIRSFEQNCLADFSEQKIRGFLHTQIGQEAVPVGAKYAMKDVDKYSGSYRTHGWYIALTSDVDGAFAEILGLAGGCSKGKGGSMHLYAPEKGLYGGQGIVGAQVPLGVGLAFAATYDSKTPKYATVALFGDGALNNGQVLEVCNMAALWKLPVIFCLEDNEYSMGTARKRGSFETSLRSRVPYIPGIDFDGMDVMASFAAFETAREYVMSEKGPILLHCHTYRFANHSASDAGTYRKLEEMLQIKSKRCPINRLAKALVQIDANFQTKLNNLYTEAYQEIQASAKRVSKMGLPSLTELTTDVYACEKVPVRSCQSARYI